MSSTTLPVCPKTGSTSPSLTVHLCLHTALLREIGNAPDRVGIEAGVTTIVDCGTAGAAMFPGFRKFVIEGARTRIYALLNISTAGCCTDEIYLDPRLINIDAARAVIAEHRDLILGLKVRVRGRHEDLEHDISVMTTARELADEMGIPIMMHWSIEPDLLAGAFPISRSSV